VYSPPGSQQPSSSGSSKPPASGHVRSLLLAPAQPEWWPDQELVRQLPLTCPDGLYVYVYVCALGGDNGRTLLLRAAPDFLEHLRAVANEAVLLAAQVRVLHAGRP
jgi:hypothetical protein